MTSQADNFIFKIPKTNPFYITKSAFKLFFFYLFFIIYLTRYDTMEFISFAKST